jgi:hypothetical protein
MRGFVTRALISAGAAVCIGGAAAFWTMQVSTTAGTLWPLPALALLDWVILGFVGFLTAGRVESASSGGNEPASWAIGGALLPLGLIGALSIGPFVLLSALLFLTGAVWNAVSHSGITGRDLRWLVSGMVGNLVLLLLFVAFG